MENKFQYDVSFVLPSLNEGDSVRQLLDEIIITMSKLEKSYEIIAIDTPSDNESFLVYKEYASRHDNFTAIQLADRRSAGTGKTVQYMIGFKLAKGRYIIHMDTDGQDNPADLDKFITKLDEGYDLVVGHKQNRKDGTFYVLQSKVGNTFTRWMTGTDVHDMNCGFKGYKSYVAKRLNLKGRWYRYIPSLLHARGYKICEVPIENRKRQFGRSNFNFKNRLQGGLFDMPLVALYNKYGETPIYLFGWLAVVSLGLAGITAVISLLTWGSQVSLIVGITTIILLAFACSTFVLGIAVEFTRMQSRVELEDHGIKEIVTKAT